MDLQSMLAVRNIVEPSRGGGRDQKYIYGCGVVRGQLHLDMPYSVDATRLL